MHWATVQLNDHRVLAKLFEADGALAGSCEWILASARVDQVCRPALQGRSLAEAAVRVVEVVLFLLVVEAALILVRAEVATQNEAIPLREGGFQPLEAAWLPIIVGTQCRAEVAQTSVKDPCDPDEQKETDRDHIAHQQVEIADLTSYPILTIDERVLPAKGQTFPDDIKPARQHDE